ncbi:unnamed protein product [Cladocopium goreaui]|uniref:Phosphopyruvate hydratase n=1 Tax=Cladocopium goreaui TaxID=2562237 RepID=A0A9P1GHW8_9DINO|nr:unnamed protein product [Cladocopium goreaui]
MDTSGRVRDGTDDSMNSELGRKRLRRSASASHALKTEPGGEGKSLEIKGLDGSTFELQVGDATVEEVYKNISEKIGLKPGRKLLLTSGCIMLDYSRPMLQQVQGGEISFIVQRISLNDFAKSFWNAIEAETKESLTAEDVHTLHVYNAPINLRTWDEHMTKCVKYIVMERQRGAAWKDIYQSPGYLRCGSLHHLCMYDPALWGLAQCDPNNAAWWKDSFAQYAVADGMAAASSSVNTVDFVISVGDNFYLRGVMDEFDLNWRYMFEEVYHHESLQVLGNHDYGGHECDGCLFEGGTGGCSDAQISYDDEKSWEFPAPKRKRWVLPKRYYKKSFKYQDFSIDVFAIDSNWVNSHSLCHGQSKITSEKVCNAAQCETFHQKTYAAQLQWLREELPKSNATWKWVVGHHPCEMLGDVMLKLFASNGVSLIFAGHVHQLRLDRVKDVSLGEE